MYICILDALNFGRDIVIIRSNVPSCAIFATEYILLFSVVKVTQFRWGQKGKQTDLPSHKSFHHTAFLGVRSYQMTHQSSLVFKNIGPKASSPGPPGPVKTKVIVGLTGFFSVLALPKHTSISSISPRLRRRGVVRPLHVAHGQRRVPASGSSIGDPSQERFDNRAGGWK